jgi:hypothetical protein
LSKAVGLKERLTAYIPQCLVGLAHSRTGCCNAKAIPEHEAMRACRETLGLCSSFFAAGKELVLERIYFVYMYLFRIQEYDIEDETRDGFVSFLWLDSTSTPDTPKALLP